MAEEKPGGVTTYAGPSFWFDGNRPGRVRVCAGGRDAFTCYGVDIPARQCREFVRDPNHPEGWGPVKE